MSKQSHNSQKLMVSTRYIPKKSRGLHDIKADILKLVYHHPRILFGLLGLEDELLGLSLCYIAKESRYLLLKRKKDKKTGWVSNSFSLSANH